MPNNNFEEFRITFDKARSLLAEAYDLVAEKLDKFVDLSGEYFPPTTALHMQSNLGKATLGIFPEHSALFARHLRDVVVGGDEYKSIQLKSDSWVLSGSKSREGKFIEPTIGVEQRYLDALQDHVEWLEMLMAPSKDREEIIGLLFGAAEEIVAAERLRLTDV